MMQITVISFQVVDFIKKHGLNGPEGKYPKEGQYTQVSDQRKCNPLGWSVGRVCTSIASRLASLFLTPAETTTDWRLRN